jgi:cell division protein FtsW
MASWIAIPSIDLFARRDTTGGLDASPRAVEEELVERGPTDVVLLLVVAALVSIGLLAVYSGSALKSYFLSSTGDDLIYFRNQMTGAVVGSVGMVVTSRIDYDVYRRFIYGFLGLSAGLLLLTAIPGLAVTVNGATRWIQLGPVRFQPAEFAKIVAVMYLAYSIAKKGARMRNFVESFVGHGLVFSVFTLLLMKQPDFGSTVVILTMVGIMLFVGGAKMSFLVAFGVAGMVSIYAAVQGASYRMSRVTAWMDPWADASESGYQLVNSYVALASGGVTGTGFGSGRGWLGYLPELYNDFVGAAIGEEFGLVGMGVLALLYVLFLWRGLSIAFQARDRFGFLLAFGLTTLITLQATMNLCVVTGILPTKGLTLPFVSYGRSSLILLLLAVGILLNIAQANPDLHKERCDARAARAEQASQAEKRERVADRRRRRARRQAEHHGA